MEIKPAPILTCELLFLASGHTIKSMNIKKCSPPPGSFASAHMYPYIPYESLSIPKI